MTLLWPHTDASLPPAGRSVNGILQQSSSPGTPSCVCVYRWRIMHPPVTLPQVNVQSVVLLQNYPAGHLILGIWLNFSFNYPVLYRAIEDSHKGPLLLMWTICFLSKNAYLSKAPDGPMGILMRFSGLCDTMQTHCKTPACLTILQMPILLQLIECN